MKLSFDSGIQQYWYKEMSFSQIQAHNNITTIQQYDKNNNIKVEK